MLIVCFGSDFDVERICNEICFCFCCSMLIMPVCWVVALILLPSKVRLGSFWSYGYVVSGLFQLSVYKYTIVTYLTFAAVCLILFVCRLFVLVWVLIGCDLSLFWSYG